jgi:hypothetical protein
MSTTRTSEDSVVYMQQIYIERDFSNTYTDSYMIEVLQSAAQDLGESFGMKKFEKWRSKQPNKSKIPSGISFVKRKFWNEWKQEAGLKQNERRDYIGIQKFSDEEILKTIHLWAGNVGRFPTLSEAKAMRKPSEPSVDLIRSRIGSWSAAHQLYLETKTEEITFYGN